MPGVTPCMTRSDDCAFAPNSNPRGVNQKGRERTWSLRDRTCPGSNLTPSYAPSGLRASVPEMVVTGGSWSAPLPFELGPVAPTGMKATPVGGATGRLGAPGKENGICNLRSSRGTRSPSTVFWRPSASSLRTRRPAARSETRAAPPQIASRRPASAVKPRLDPELVMPFSPHVP